MSMSVIIGSRGSALALAQSQIVARLLRLQRPTLDVRLRVFTTKGDRVLDKPLPSVGGKGLFTEELEAALRSGEIDLAVHSMKDLPTDGTPGLTIGAVPRRATPNDLFISRHRLPLAQLPPQPRIGTSSVRRAVQLLTIRPDAQVLPLRGNVNTRLRKALDPAGPYDGIVLAQAGLERLGFWPNGSGNESLPPGTGQPLPLSQMLPAPAQGALAVQCRADDEAILQLLALIDHRPTRLAVTAERCFLAAMGGGCSLPIAAYATISDTGNRITIDTLLGDEQGNHSIRLYDSVPLTDPCAIGRSLADRTRCLGEEQIKEAPTV